MILHFLVLIVAVGFFLLPAALILAAIGFLRAAKKSLQSRAENE